VTSLLKFWVALIASTFAMLFVFLVAMDIFFQLEGRHEKFYCDRIQASYANDHPTAEKK
jgi:hypothetical protein